MARRLRLIVSLVVGSQFIGCGTGDAGLTGGGFVQDADLPPPRMSQDFEVLAPLAGGIVRPKQVIEVQARLKAAEARNAPQRLTFVFREAGQPGGDGYEGGAADRSETRDGFTSLSGKAVAPSRIGTYELTARAWYPGFTRSGMDESTTKGVVRLEESPSVRVEVRP